VKDPEILFENDDILAINKPEGLASISEGTQGPESLFATLSSAFAGNLYVVHRLDKDVSGVILFAKKPTAHKYLNLQFSGRDVRKTYLALIHGLIREKSGVIDRPLREFGSGRMGVDPQRGKPSTTEFRVMERFDSYTLVKVSPLTGRRHQIRVHFYSIGHPIVGDLRYGDRALQRTYPRLMLHAQKVSFRLPSDEQFAVEAPVPTSFRTVVDMLRTPGR
jgi:tRNA pseudouridine32 synthase/23S rRNA pseudouridine746 synthase